MIKGALSLLRFTKSRRPTCRSSAFRFGRASPPLIARPFSTASTAPCVPPSTCPRKIASWSCHEHDETDFSYSSNYLGIARSDDLVIIQITANNTRTTEKKKAFYRQIVENLKADPGVRPEDVFVNLVEVLPENWSFGNGIAQYAADKR